ncbi:MAG: DNA/RNA nuclease SfsA [Acidimicrobiia bacterium]
MTPKPKRQEVVLARFVARPNRFLVMADLEDGRQVEAYLPNTGRLTHLTTPGRPLMLRCDGTASRRTEYTVIRAWDGCWVALEASLAPRLLADWLLAGHSLATFGKVTEVKYEVTAEGHRLDLRVETEKGPVWVEVKSGGRSSGRTALLSATPSTRGVSHLEALARLVARGEQAVAAFVIQRPDVDSLLIGGDADQGWIEAVHSAREAGVTITAFGCQVTESEVRIDRELPVVWETPPTG